MSIMNSNFLIYLGWKTLGWALVFLAVTLLAKILRMWLLHHWAKELAGGNAGAAATRSELQRSREEAALEICSRMERNRRLRNQRILMRWAGHDAQLYAAATPANEPCMRSQPPQRQIPDLPPDYLDVVDVNDLPAVHNPKINPADCGPTPAEEEGATAAMVTNSTDEVKISIPESTNNIEKEEEEMPPDYATLFKETKCDVEETRINATKA